MAETADRMRIGSLVSPAGRRHPALFAKMTSIVDIISNGRLTVGMGAGNSPDQRAIQLDNNPEDIISEHITIFANES